MDEKLQAKNSAKSSLGDAGNRIIDCFNWNKPWIYQSISKIRGTFYIKTLDHWINCSHLHGDWHDQRHVITVVGWTSKLYKANLFQISAQFQWDRSFCARWGFHLELFSIAVTEQLNSFIFQGMVSLYFGFEYIQWFGAFRYSDVIQLIMQSSIIISIVLTLLGALPSLENQIRTVFQ